MHHTTCRHARAVYTQAARAIAEILAQEDGDGSGREEAQSQCTPATHVIAPRVGVGGGAGASRTAGVMPSCPASEDAHREAAALIRSPSPNAPKRSRQSPLARAYLAMGP